MLKIKGLRKTFGSVIAADDIDLSVAPGEALGIIGPNGRAGLHPMQVKSA